MELSIILPVYNEEKNLRPLFDELKDILEENFTSYEVIFVNDGSEDASQNILKELGKQHEEVKWLELRKNFGQSEAIQTGINHSEGDLVVTMDSDMQNDPRDIPRLVKKLENTESDLVNGWRKQRQDPFMKTVFSGFASFLRRIILGAELHDYGCTLKVMKREVAESLELRGEMHRYIPALIKIHGFKVSEIKVNHRERNASTTKYGLKRLPKGFIDLTKVWFWKEFKGRPLHIFGGVGLASIFLGGLVFSFALYQKINGTSLSDTGATVISVFLILIGAQLFLSGILAEMIQKNRYASETTNYRIKRIKK